MHESPSRSFMRTAWLTVILLMPVALLNYLDRQMLATMKSAIVDDLTDLDTQAKWGVVLGSFKWVYALLSPVGGYLADRLSRRHVIAGSLFVWSAVTWLTGQVHSYHELVAARALMGISEAFYIPAALALITDFHPGSTRSRAVGLHQLGIFAGVIIGGFGGYVAAAPQLGWRFAFEFCGLVGILYSLPLFWILKNPPRDVHAPAHVSPYAALQQLLTNRDFLLLVLYFTLPALAGWVVRDWMPHILLKEFNLGLGQAGVSAVLYVQLASMVGVVLGGWLADSWMKTSLRGRIRASALGTFLLIPALFGVGNATSLGMAIAFLMLFGLGWGFFDCNNMPILCQITRPHLRATGYGLMNLVSISCGGFADWGFGILRDRNVPLNVIFGAFGAVALLSAAIVLMIRPRPVNELEQVPTEQTASV
ncbi:MFS transporter [Planctomicrobium sp. SH664]|uniref:MFS transporter n=1 Tax=Planctomicrobium sp. SH664 TaxID=3448125 RepID=UPI003F5B248B